MEYKNWSLFIWALRRLELDYNHNNDVVCKRNLKNKILLRLMDLSGVTPNDGPCMLQEFENELKRRGEL